MTKPKSILYLLGDIAALNFALIATYFMVFNETGFFKTLDFRVIALLVNLLWCAVLLYSSQIYTRFEYKGLSEEVQNLLPNFLIYCFGFYFFSILLFYKIEFPFLLFYSFSLAFMILSRWAMRLLVSFRPLRYITIGYSEALPRIEAALSEAHNGKTECLGAFGGSSVHQKNHIGRADEVEAFLEKNRVNMIFYVSNTVENQLLRQIMEYAKHHFIEFKIIPLELDCLTEGARFELHHGVFLSAKDVYLAHLRSRVLKRAFDIAFSVFVIVFILSWLFPIIALLIKLESRGSVLFLQDRIGHRGKIFRCIKFRTMTVAENGSVVEQAKRNDSRVTRIGSFLRRSNLDEMPQFFNVLLGNMSVVGPRPHAVAHDKEFQVTKYDYILRHHMKPGITGWAQVNGWRGPTDTYQKIAGRTEFDLWYVENGSIWLDLKIVYMTIFGSKAWEEAF